MKNNKLIIIILIASICLQIGTLISVNKTTEKEATNENTTVENKSLQINKDSQ